MSSISITVHSTNEKMGYQALVPGREPLPLDYVKPYGDDLGHTPMELVLVALATCTGSGVGILLRKQNKRISSLVVSATGDRSDAHPTVFRSIELHLDVTGERVTSEEMESVLKVAETTLCPVYIMLAAQVEIRVSYTLKS